MADEYIRKEQGTAGGEKYEEDAHRVVRQLV